MIIYVSGPYSAPTEEGREQNTADAIDTAVKLAEKGHVPFIPHLYHWFDKAAKNRHLELSWSDYLAWDLAFLQKCDALFLCSRSPGADLEHRMAKIWGLPVYTELYQVPEG